MSKPSTIFECGNCGAQYPKWEGRCRQCGKWGTILESNIQNQEVKKSEAKNAAPSELVDFANINARKYPRIETGIGEFDRVLGGGIVAGSIILIGGAPGIGKSTLVLQALAKIKPPIVYFSGEESAQQIKSRAARLSLGALPAKLAAGSRSPRLR